MHLESFSWGRTDREEEGEEASRRISLLLDYAPPAVSLMDPLKGKVNTVQAAAVTC